ncbi:MAG: AAA family ATPase [Labilithrix sp.]|nr:AAA family ATPase [Labilithrix sp.]MCW5818218.1 AAA family ATPase [Labilithrix sp.]
MSPPLVPHDRLETGVAGLDRVLGGGLLRGGLHVVAGRAGVGKTTLASQIAFHSVARGARAVYATFLVEPHERLLHQLRSFAFFDGARVGRELVYLDAYPAFRAGGLDALTGALRGMIRDRDASLLVLDGLPSAEDLRAAPLEHRAFLVELQASLVALDCTALLVTSGDADHATADGVFELASTRAELRRVRELTVRKLRGGGHIDGTHVFRVTSDGVVVYPRLEAIEPDAPGATAPVQDGRVPFGVAGLDDLFSGGVARGSTTLLLGPSGAGKTILGLHFLAAGAASGDKALHFGFHERSQVLLRKGDRLGMRLSEHAAAGDLVVHWEQPSEALLDQVMADLLAIVERERVRRLFIDGFAGLRTAVHPERLAGMLAAAAELLSRAGVTTLVTDETRELYVKDVSVSTPNVSATFDNIVLLRRVLLHAQLVHQLSIMKTRDTPHDNRAWELAVTREGMFLVAPFDTPEARRLRGDGSGAIPKERPATMPRRRPKRE